MSHWYIGGAGNSSLFSPSSTCVPFPTQTDVVAAPTPLTRSVPLHCPFFLPSLFSGRDKSETRGKPEYFFLSFFSLEGYTGLPSDARQELNSFVISDQSRCTRIGNWVCISFDWCATKMLQFTTELSKGNLARFKSFV